jgi:CRP-like cAMP-binding protein
MICARTDRLRGVSSIQNNLLLTGLDPPGRPSLLHEASRVQLLCGESLTDEGDERAHVYFPIDSSVSVAIPLAGEPPAVVGLVGCEGMIGMHLMLDCAATDFVASVQVSGSAWRVASGRFNRELAGNAGFHARMNHYLHVRLLQLALAGSCRAGHLLEERLASWLLMSRDRVRSDRILLTHEMLARALGVRRTGVTQAASALQERGLIRYSRGRIQLLDCRGLQAAACTCYAAEKRIYTRFMRVTG